MATKASKRVSRQVMESFGRVLQAWVRDKFEGNQSEAAKSLGVSQPHISGMISGEKGPGINTLLLMRNATGKTIDEMLGFHASPQGELIGQLVATFELDVARLKKELSETKEEAARLRRELEGSKKSAPVSRLETIRKQGTK